MPPGSRTVSAIVTELVEHPFFPILFFGEFMKALVTGANVAEFGVLAFIAIVLWTFSDAVTETIDFLQVDILGTKEADD